MTVVRAAELRFAKWQEFEDLKGRAPLRRRPEGRMKMRRAHLVPLSTRAVDVVQGLRKLTGAGEHMVPAPAKTGVISENTLLFPLHWKCSRAE